MNSIDFNTLFSLLLSFHGEIALGRNLILKASPGSDANIAQHTKFIVWQC